MLFHPYLSEYNPKVYNFRKVSSAINSSSVKREAITRISRSIIRLMNVKTSVLRDRSKTPSHVNFTLKRTVYRLRSIQIHHTIPKSTSSDAARVKKPSRGKGLQRSIRCRGQPMLNCNAFDMCELQVQHLQLLACKHTRSLKEPCEDGIHARSSITPAQPDAFTPFSD